jgi:hypothetical protein
LASQIFDPKFENNFKASFSGVGVHGVFTSRSPLEKLLALALEKSHLIKIAFGLQGKCTYLKAGSSSQQIFLVPKRPEGLSKLGVFKVFMSYDSVY